MKVIFAANTLSASVANAIDFSRNEGLDNFRIILEIVKVLYNLLE